MYHMVKVAVVSTYFQMFSFNFSRETRCRHHDAQTNFGEELVCPCVQKNGWQSLQLHNKSP